MKTYISLLFLVLLSLTGCRASPQSSTDFASDTIQQEFSRLIPAIEVPDFHMEEGQKLRLSTPELDISLTKAGPYLALEGTRQVIRQQQTKIVQVPVKIKDKSRVTITENSHNSDNRKDKSKVKTELELNENSNNRHKEKTSDPTTLLILIGAVAFAVYLVIRFKDKIPFI